MGRQYYRKSETANLHKRIIKVLQDNPDMTAAQVAQRFSVSTSYVRRIAKEANLNPARHEFLYLNGPKDEKKRQGKRDVRH